MNQSSSIAVIGAGSWGTALAILLSKNQHYCYLWGRNKEKIANMQATRMNEDFLVGRVFPELLHPENNLRKVVVKSDILLITVPSHAFRETIKQIKLIKSDVKQLCWATKGLETGTQKFIHEIVQEELGNEVDMAVISGPTFANEVAKGLPTAVTIASEQQSFAKKLAHLLHNTSFRPYLSDDIIGLEIGGAVKNVLAIAAGIADGLGYGANTRAALITRGIAEMTRLAVQCGAKQETLMGLAGMGDLLLTCTDDQSRNRRLGLAIGAGMSMKHAQQEIKQVTEGVQATEEIFCLAKKLQVKMPIVEQVYLVLYQHKSAVEAVKSLLERSFNYEH